MLIRKFAAVCWNNSDFLFNPHFLIHIATSYVILLCLCRTMEKVRYYIANFTEVLLFHSVYLMFFAAEATGWRVIARNFRSNSGSRLRQSTAVDWCSCFNWSFVFCCSIFFPYTRVSISLELLELDFHFLSIFPFSFLFFLFVFPLFPFSRAIIINEARVF